MALKDHDLMEKSYHEVLAELLSRLPVEQRLAGLEPEEVLSKFSADKRLAGLEPEEVMSRFSVDKRLAGLEPEQVFKGLSPEVREQLKRLLH